ncbi:hypothetical protein V6N12_025556 [Hibiscus sabdariffa]|uniref:Uncharacterized protein n=1 Tax=Hibiscus sabdariffa TaxID=183260 RepID=A0ABR2CIU4_9ROSI
MSPEYSIDINRNPPVPLPNSQHKSAGANNLVAIAQAPPPVDFCTLFCSDEANQASRSRSTVSINKDDLPPTARDDLKRTQDYDIGPPPFSSAGKFGLSERSLLSGKESK